MDKDTEMNKNMGIDKDMIDIKNIDSSEVIQDIANLDNHTVNENSCKLFSWNSLPDFLQEILPSDYTYKVQCITKLLPYYTEKEFEIQQFEV
ncbi:26518_t:CDS:2, partial [Dentiscutata erythropus]